ncbi:hypothetical protein ST37_16705 [Vibrio sp. qd031]|uniref:AAA family ATPase n=1 Tax=Vibrio sp. qd031 TaxID=1603038 RepID=UPI000A0FDB1F|nr:AAA family ATPase [Vibrio sp. qd031]ORT48714.1 hypothetical protein ST37_16705 [Vibrio sp. qd031]
MKILSVQFSNINSLKGEWKIDFTKPPFSENALFAITGPTGAGKTTILDAICLALYHKTPRIKVVSSSTNELMTHGTGECSAEVVFSVKSVEYIASWSMKRARGKADGKLQSALVSLAERQSGKIIASQIKPKLDAIESVTGLDFERFTKSMLLSQGDFAAFLNAEEGERAELLEELTGTEIYGLISQQVHQHFTEAKQKKELLSARSQGIELLSDDEKSAFAQSLSENEVRIRDLKKELVTHSSNLNWWQNYNATAERLALTASAKLQAQSELDACDAVKQQLMDVELAKGMEPLYEEYQRLSNEREQAALNERTVLSSLTASEQLLPKFEKDVAAATQAVEDDRQQLEHFEAHIVSQIAPLDKQIDIESQQLQRLRAKHDTLSEQHIPLQQEIKLLIEKQLGFEQDIERVLAYQKRYSLDDQLEQNLPLWQHKMAQLQQEQSKVRDHEVALAADGKLIEQSIQRRASLVSTREAQSVELEPSQKKLTDLKRQIEDGLASFKGDIKELHAATEKARIQQQMADELLRTHNTALDLKGQLAQSARSVGEDRELEAQCLKSIATLKADYRECDTQVKWLEKLVSQADTIAMLRTELKDDQPCVVCGSREHQAIDDTLTELSDEKQQLQQKAAQLKAITEQGQAQREQQAVLKQKIEHQQHLISSLQPEYDVAREKWNTQLNALVETGFNLVVDFEQIQTSQSAAEHCRAQFEQTNALALLIQSLTHESSRMEAFIQQANTAIQGLDNDIRAIESELKSSQEREQHTREQLSKTKQSWQGALEDLKASIHRFVEIDSVVDASELVDGLTALRERLAAWKKHESELLNAKNARIEISQALAQKNTINEQWTTDLNEMQSELTTKQQQLNELQEKRFSILGRKTIDDTRAEFKQKLVINERGQQAASAKLRECETSITQLKTELNSVKAHLQKLTLLQQQANQQWLNTVEESSFDNEEAFKQTLQLHANAPIWKKQIALAEQALQHALGEWSAIDKQQQEILNKKPSELPDEESCKRAVSTTEEAIQQIQQQNGEINSRIDIDHQNQSKAAELVEEMKAFDIYYDDIAYLHGLIGSSSGDKFRKFAQSLTLDNLVYLANKRLAQLHGRYRLKRNQNTDLQFNVIDSWQADVERDTKTLSGGESFLVSLALALALSDLVSHKTSIDSLFLDEGFGTLDSETLDIALDALDNLQTSGKMIGVISHIDALKERIPTQLVVSKKSGLGVSVLADPYRVAS